MSFIPYFNFRKFDFKKSALLLGLLLAQQSVLARSDGYPPLFQAATSAGADTPAHLPTVRSDAASRISFIAFMPKPDATNIRNMIATAEDAGDMYSPRIAELSQELGKALQADGDHRAALEAFDRSFQIVRRQEGLFSAAQTSILQAKIKSQLAMGDMDASDVLQHALFLMQQQLLADKPVALARAYLTLADWNLKYYLEMRRVAVPGGRTDAQEKAFAQRLGEAFMQYHKGLWLFSTAEKEGLYAEKVAVERKIAALTLMVNRQHQDDMPNTLTKLGQSSSHQSRQAHDPILFNHGSAALLRAIDYSMATAEPVLIAERQLELADWYLLMDQYDQARATYASAMESLRDAGVEDEQIAVILGSGFPVHDPEAALLALAADDTEGNSDHYIDVTFDVNQSGKASNARVLATSSPDVALEEDLLRQINAERFRPGFAEGTPVDLDDVTLRYYLAR